MMQERHIHGKQSSEFNKIKQLVFTFSFLVSESCESDFDSTDRLDSAGGEPLGEPCTRLSFPCDLPTDDLPYDDTLRRDMLI